MFAGIQFAISDSAISPRQTEVDEWALCSSVFRRFGIEKGILADKAVENWFMPDARGIAQVWVQVRNREAGRYYRAWMY